MPSVTLRELSRNTSDVIDTVRESGRPALVTRNGRLVAALVPVDEEAIEDFVLATLPELVQDMEEADRELAAGETVSLETFLGQLQEN